MISESLNIELFSFLNSAMDNQIPNSPDLFNETLEVVREPAEGTLEDPIEILSSSESDV